MLDALLAAFLLLQVADYATTHKIIQLGGYERNPLVRMAMDTFGVIPALLLYKALGCVAGWLVYSTGAMWAMAGLVAFMLVVVVNNGMVLRRLGQPNSDT